MSNPMKSRASLLPWRQEPPPAISMPRANDPNLTPWLMPGSSIQAVVRIHLPSARGPPCRTSRKKPSPWSASSRRPTPTQQGEDPPLPFPRVRLGLIAGAVIIFLPVLASKS